jgi:hypothetical protein
VVHTRYSLLLICNLQVQWLKHLDRCRGSVASHLGTFKKLQSAGTVWSRMASPTFMVVGKLLARYLGSLSCDFSSKLALASSHDKIIPGQ